MFTGNSIAASCHGKIILLGEHSVVYGYPSLARPVKSLNITTRVAKAFRGSTVTTYDYHGSYTELTREFGGIKSIIVALQDMVGARAANFSMSFQSNIPMERGLGSSAAISVSTTKALASFWKIDLGKEKLIQIANAAETINHGSASGLDVATVLSDSTLAFTKAEGPSYIANDLGAYLIIGDTGIKGNTREAVTLVRDETNSDAKAVEAIEDLGSIAQRGIAAWQGKDVETFGALMDQAQGDLSYLKVSSPELDALVKAAKANGALGAKLSGGGLGGVMIALAKDGPTADRIRTALLAHDAKGVWIDRI